jgi:hypothetical protein
MAQDNLDTTLLALGLQDIPGECVAILRAESFYCMASFELAEKEELHVMGLKYGVINIILLAVKNFVQRRDRIVVPVHVSAVKILPTSSAPSAVSSLLERTAPPVGFGSAMTPSRKLESKRPATDIAHGSFTVNYEGGWFVGAPSQDRKAVKLSMTSLRVEVKGVGTWH